MNQEMRRRNTLWNPPVGHRALLVAGIVLLGSGLGGVAAPGHEEVDGVLIHAPDVAPDPRERIAALQAAAARHASAGLPRLPPPMAMAAAPLSPPTPRASATDYTYRVCLVETKGTACSEPQPAGVPTVHRAVVASAAVAEVPDATGPGSRAYTFTVDASATVIGDAAVHIQLSDRGGPFATAVESTERVMKLVIRSPTSSRAVIHPNRLELWPDALADAEVTLVMPVFQFHVKMGSGTYFMVHWTDYDTLQYEGLHQAVSVQTSNQDSLPPPAPSGKLRHIVKVVGSQVAFTGNGPIKLTTYQGGAVTTFAGLTLDGGEMNEFLYFNSFPESEVVLRFGLRSTLNGQPLTVQSIYGVDFEDQYIKIKLLPGYSPMHVTLTHSDSATIRIHHGWNLVAAEEDVESYVSSGVVYLKLTHPENKVRVETQYQRPITHQAAGKDEYSMAEDLTLYVDYETYSKCTRPTLVVESFDASSVIFERLNFDALKVTASGPSTTTPSLKGIVACEELSAKVRDEFKLNTVQLSSDNFEFISTDPDTARFEPRYIVTHGWTDDNSDTVVEVSPRLQETLAGREFVVTTPPGGASFTDVPDFKRLEKDATYTQCLAGGCTIKVTISPRAGS